MRLTIINISKFHLRRHTTLPFPIHEFNTHLVNNNNYYYYNNDIITVIYNARHTADSGALQNGFSVMIIN